MDPANASELRDILSSNDARMERQEEQIFATGRAVQALVAQVSGLTAQLQQMRTEVGHVYHHQPLIPVSHIFADHFWLNALYFLLSSH